MSGPALNPSILPWRHTPSAYVERANKGRVPSFPAGAYDDSVAYFLAKTEPSVYSIDTFRSELETFWDGVRNPQAVAAIRSMKKGDKVFIYHSGGVSAIVGIGQVLAPAEDDPKDPKSAIVKLKYVSHLDPPTTLAEIKQSGLFSDWSLVRQSRLSTMSAPETFVAWMRERYPKSKL